MHDEVCGCVEIQLFIHLTIASNDNIILVHWNDFLPGPKTGVPMWLLAVPRCQTPLHPFSTLS